MGLIPFLSPISIVEQTDCGLRSDTMLWLLVSLSSLPFAKPDCPGIWTEGWRRSIRTAIGTLYRKAKTEENYVFKPRNPCLPNMSKFNCITKGSPSRKFCEITLTATEQYVGNMRASTDNDRGQVCKLSFYTSLRNP